jgi:hypothetical protein
MRAMAVVSQGDRFPRITTQIRGQTRRLRARVICPVHRSGGAAIGLTVSGRPTVDRESAGVVVAGPDRREAVLSPTNGYSHSLHTDLGILRIYTVCSCVSSKAREVVYSDPLSPDVVGEPRLRTNLASWRLFGGQFSKRRRCGGASEPRDESPPSGRHAGTTHRAGLTTT